MSINVYVHTCPRYEVSVIKVVTGTADNDAGRRQQQRITDDCKGSLACLTDEPNTEPICTYNVRTRHQTLTRIY